MSIYNENSISMVMYHYVKPVKNSKYPKLKALEINDESILVLNSKSGKFKIFKNEL